MFQKCHFFRPQNVSHLTNKYFIRKNPCSTTIPIPENPWLYSKDTFSIFHFCHLPLRDKNMFRFFNRTFTQISKKSSKTTIPIWRHDFRKTFKKCISILGFNFFNRTFTQIFKKTIFRTIFIWRHCNLPR